jgi:periplasmic protein TonB
MIRRAIERTHRVAPVGKAPPAEPAPGEPTKPAPEHSVAQPDANPSEAAASTSDTSLGLSQPAASEPAEATAESSQPHFFPETVAPLPAEAPSAVQPTLADASAASEPKSTPSASPIGISTTPTELPPGVDVEFPPPPIETRTEAPAPLIPAPLVVPGPVPAAPTVPPHVPKHSHREAEPRVRAATPARPAPRKNEVQATHGGEQPAVRSGGERGSGAAERHSLASARSGTGGEAPTAGAAEIASYRGLVLAHLARYKDYPEQARAQGIAGKPAVSFTLSRNGSVISVSLLRASGATLLDQATLAMVRRAAPFPPMPAGGAATMTFTAAINYSLR